MLIKISKTFDGRFTAIDHDTYDGADGHPIGEGETPTAAVGDLCFQLQDAGIYDGTWEVSE